MWVAIIVPSTGVVIISNVIIIIPTCNHKKPPQKSPDNVGRGSGWLGHTPWWLQSWCQSLFHLVMMLPYLLMLVMWWGFGVDAAR